MRVFTLEEARRTLAQVHSALEELREVASRLRDLQRAVTAAARGSTADGHALGDPFVEGGENPALALSAQMRNLLARLHESGIEVKDPGRGLIDFRHLRDGEMVYLCYHLGEPDIAYWHPLDAGFAGRRPI